MDECVVTSDAGTCFSPASCLCTGQSCSFACGAADAGLEVVCEGASICSVSCLGDCDVECAQSMSCNADVHGSGEVNCAQSEGCVATVGPGATVNCSQATSCDVTCEGACMVDCVQAGTCAVKCAGGLAGCEVDCLGPQTPTVCPDGITKTCGGGC
jgi:hypothetical protein